LGKIIYLRWSSCIAWVHFIYLSRMGVDCSRRRGGNFAFAGVAGSNAKLYATKFEFVTTGNIGRRGASGRVIVFTADVERLEFRDPTGQRSGLYALTVRKGHCILPFLDYSQTMEVVRAIENKFPGLAERWRENAASAGGALSSGSLGGLF
jgi:hypothetical protein